jgi:hypothetical protein
MLTFVVWPPDVSRLNVLATVETAVGTHDDVLSVVVSSSSRSTAWRHPAIGG